MAVAADPTIRRQVVSAAREELAANPEASVERIARRAGVSRATFYRHFGSRAAMLETVTHSPRPPARTRILVAAQEMLVRSSLGALSMDDLARAADVSRGTLYRIFPGKAALMEGLIEAYTALHPNVTIEIETHPGGAEGDNLVKTRLATGDMSDMFYYNSGSLLQALNPSDTLVDLSAEPFIANIQESYLPTVSANGGTGDTGMPSAVPSSTHSAVVLRVMIDASSPYTSSAWTRRLR